MSTTIDGKKYAQMLLGGASNLSSKADEINSLNVFPVADGDTGTNMFRTMEGGLEEIDKVISAPDIGEISRLFSRGMLLAARGNSGVILSQIFAGINEKLSGSSEVKALELADAYRNGIKKSYAAVQNPTEGTILTVFRESTEYASERMNDDSTIEDFFRLHLEKARQSLDETKELLPVLAEADVVDSGALGYLTIAEGMYSALTNEKTAYNSFSPKTSQNVNIDLFTRDSKLEFGYCTEFLLRLTTDRVDPDNFDINGILEILEELGGESIVAYKQDDIVKVHVHTFHPGDILSKMQSFGEFLTIKIENMSLGHSESIKPKKEQAPEKKYAVVSVASGSGMAEIFSSMGADQIISGGATSNPSTEEFIKAFGKCNAENIIVFPNHKNIFLAAKQAADLYKDSKVYVVETKNQMQGYAALSVLTPGITDIESLVASAKRAASDMIDGSVSKAVRDATIDSVDIKCGEYIAFCCGRIVSTAHTAEDAVLEVLESADMDLAEIITIFTGKDVTAENSARLVGIIEDKYGDCEVVTHDGGQEIYDYYIAVE